MKTLCTVTTAALALALGLATLLGADKPSPPSPRPRIDSKADALLKQTTALLAAAKSFTVDAHTTTEQLLPSGQKIQFARNMKITLRRPDGLAVSVAGDTDDSQFMFDGKIATQLNLRTHTYSQIQAPATVDDTLDLLANKYGVVIPLADLLFTDSYKAVAENIHSGQYIGISTVFDTKCHYLAFRQESVDWQIWIDAGDKPLPLKLVISYKDSPAHLEYTAFLSKWNLAPEIPAAKFTFTPPDGAKKVEMTVPAAEPVGDTR